MRAGGQEDRRARKNSAESTTAVSLVYNVLLFMRNRKLFTSIILTDLNEEGFPPDADFSVYDLGFRRNERDSNSVTIDRSPLETHSIDVGRRCWPKVEVFLQRQQTRGFRINVF